MSVYSNLASGAAEHAEAYVEAVLRLVGDRETMEVLAETPHWLRDFVGALPESSRETAEAVGKWSVAGVLQHLADSELVWGYRLRKVLAEDRPRLDGFDQDSWSDRLGYDAADWARALAVFSTLREANLILLDAASEDDLDRTGVHDERGDETLRHMTRLYAGHDLVHRRQVERIAAAVASSGGRAE